MSSASSLPAFEQHFITANDVTIHYARVPGAPRPMVMLHGIGMDWRVWQAVSRRLAPSFDLYLLDLRGHGESSKPSHGYTLPHYAADVEDVIDRLRLTDAVLVGSSLGGVVATAAEVPVDVVSHRVLVDPPLTGGPVRDAGTLEEILRLKHEPVPVLAGYLHHLNPRAGRFLVRAMSEMWHEASDGVIEDVLSHEDSYFDLGSALSLDEAPTLLMRADPEMGGVLSEADAERAARALPQATVVTVPGAGHAIHADKPAEFVRLIHDFVESGETANIAPR